MIRKYRTIEEAGKDFPRFMYELRKKRGIVPAIYPTLKQPRGIKKFKTIEDANRDRQELIVKSREQNRLDNS